jgi:aminopeptidase N
MVRFLLALLLVSATPALSQVSSPTFFRPQVFDVEHYDADITFPNPAAKTIVGRCRIAVRWTADTVVSTFPINLRGLTIDSVFVIQQQRSRTSAPRVGTDNVDTMHYAVAINARVKRNQRDTIDVFYSGTMTNEGGPSAWGGVHYQDSVLYCLGVGFASPNVSATQHWLPCYDHPSDKATFHARFHVPDAQWLVASNGVATPVAVAPDARATYEWTETHPSATYLLTFAVGRYITQTAPGVVPHIYYMRRRDSASAAIAFSRVPQMTETYAQLYGPYPFAKVGYYASQLGSMEHQGMIAIALREVQRKDSANIVAAHELAHQWFGDCVTPQDFRYAWLSESFATFSESVWLEQLRGTSVYLSSVQSKARLYITQIAPLEGWFALEDFPRVSPSSNYPATIYQKGAVVLAMARAIAGDTAFFAALRSYVQRNAYGNATTATFREAIRPALGDRTDAFFSEWVTGKGWALLDVEHNITDKRVRIRQVQPATQGWPIFTTLPLNVTYARRDGERSTIIDTIMFCAADGSWTVTCDSLIGINTGTRSRVLASIVKSTVTSADEHHSSAQERYSVAPNPAADRVRIMRTSSQREARISIVSVDGRVVVRDRITSGTTEHSVSTAGFASGGYAIVIEEPGATYTLPLVITHAE